MTHIYIHKPNPKPTGLSSPARAAHMTCTQCGIRYNLVQNSFDNISSYPYRQSSKLRCCSLEGRREGTVRCFESSICCCRADGPIIECDSTVAEINQFNVYLRCLVRAQPSVTSLFWIADVNGTTVSDDAVTSDYWSTVTV